jgi:hypothetical protein
MICTGELVALHAALFLLRSLIGQYWVTSCSTVKISTMNSQTALILSQLWKIKRHNPRWRLNRNWEVLSNIQNDIADNLLKIINQSEDPFGEYSQRAAAKCLLEYEASPEYQQRPLLQPVNSTGRAYLQHGLEIINDKYDASIHERHNAATYKQYVREKRHWSKQVFKSVEWTAFHHEAKKLNVNERTQLLKFVYGWLPIRKRRKAIDPKANIICPNCRTMEETHDHILQCEEPKQRIIFEGFASSFQQLCEKSKVYPHLTETFLAHLTAWIEQSETHDYPNNNALLCQVVTEQNSIGWDNCMQ